MIPLIPIFIAIASRPEVQDAALKAVAWAANKLLEYENGAGKRSQDAEYHASIETMRVALQKGDVDAIIDHFNANHDVVAQLRVPGYPTATG